MPFFYFFNRYYCPKKQFQCSCEYKDIKVSVMFYLYKYTSLCDDCNRVLQKQHVSANKTELSKDLNLNMTSECRYSIPIYDG